MTSQPDDVNFLCEHDGCSETAHVFGLTGRVKKRRCEHHILDLTRKKMQIYDISAYPFITSSDDAARCESRRQFVENGLKNAALLESCCEGEMESVRTEIAQRKTRAMQILNFCFEEIEGKVQLKYEEVKSQIAEMKTNLRTFLYNEEAKLRPNEELMGKPIEFNPKILRFAFSDFMVPMVKLVFSEFALAANGLELMLQSTNAPKRKELISYALRDYEYHKSNGHTGKAAEALSYARALGYEAATSTTLSPESDDLIAKELVQLLPTVIDIDTVKTAARAYLDEANAAQQRFQYEESHRLSQMAWGLLAARNIEDKERVLAGGLLGHVLSHQFSLFPEAEIFLKQSLAIEEKLRPGSDEELTLSTELMISQYLRGNYSHCEQQCKKIIKKYPEYKELVWTSALFLLWSLREQHKDNEKETISTIWTEKLSKVEVKYAKLITTFLKAEEKMQLENTNIAEKLYLSAQKLAAECSFPSIFETEIYRQLGEMYVKTGNLEHGQKTYLKVLNLFEKHYPNCIQTANTLKSLAEISVKMKKMEDAKGLFSKATVIYSGYYPKNAQTALFYHDYAKFSLLIGLTSQAESLLTSAKAIYQELNLQGDVGECAYALGKVCESRRDLEGALAHVNEAFALWEAMKDKRAVDLAQPVIEKLKAALNPTSIFSYFTSLFR